MALSLFTNLETEWADLARSATALESLRRWGIEDAHLARFGNLDELATFARTARGIDDRDDVLRCLAARAAAEPLAARTLLQCVLYLLIPIAVSFRPTVDNDEEIDAIVVAIAFERIRTYPVQRRPRRIAANIVLDTRQRVSRRQCRRRVREVLTDDIANWPVEEPQPPAADQIVSLLDEAVRNGHLGTFDARVIALTRLGDVDINALAEAHGYQPQSLRRRRLRAEMALARAVA
ncbi:MAG: hypothetical protein ABI658_31350 [Acidimicrobiales bacterium]